jgi:ABC-2 type transport system ATP-binding protein
MIAPTEAARNHPPATASLQGRPVIEVFDLVRGFGEHEAVRGVTLSVGEGEIFGFLGPNGAGKTTTINVLTTLLRPSSGRALVAGFDVASQRSQVRGAIGLVFQASTLDDALTAEQNLRFHGYAYAVPAAVRERRMTELLRLVELDDRRRERVRTFSGGMRRRLEIARGLLHRPQILFLDEPTLGLDPQTRRRIWEYLLELRERDGLTIFVTTHYLDEADNADRIAIIDAGRIVALDTPSILKSSVGGDWITLSTDSEQSAAAELRDRYRVMPLVSDGEVSFQVPSGEAFLPDFVRGFSQPIRAVGLRRPTLDDVFMKLTGREIRDGGDASS